MPFEDSVINLSFYKIRPPRETKSPFRYPGGKGFPSGCFAYLLNDFDNDERHDDEPSCKGAGSAWNLPANG